MKTNEDLQKDVLEAIKWEPLLSPAEIGVTVKDGVVTLTGTVDSYYKKVEAEDAAKKVSGVKVLIEKIEIKYIELGKTGDDEIAQEIINAFKWNWSVPSSNVKVKVEKGWVTLDGNLRWNSQRETAVRIVKNLRGVIGVSDNLKIKSEVQDLIEQEEIVKAINRNWTLEDKHIIVEVAGNKVTLKGDVNSLYQKEEAEKIVWNATGVSFVENNLNIINS